MHYKVKKTNRTIKRPDELGGLAGNYLLAIYEENHKALWDLLSTESKAMILGVYYGIQKITQDKTTRPAYVKKVMDEGSDNELIVRVLDWLIRECKDAWGEDLLKRGGLGITEHLEDGRARVKIATNFRGNEEVIFIARTPLELVWVYLVPDYQAGCWKIDLFGE